MRGSVQPGKVLSREAITQWSVFIKCRIFLPCDGIFSNRSAPSITKRAAFLRAVHVVQLSGEGPSPGRTECQHPLWFTKHLLTPGLTGHPGMLLGGGHTGCSRGGADLNLCALLQPCETDWESATEPGTGGSGCPFRAEWAQAAQGALPYLPGLRPKVTSQVLCGCTCPPLPTLSTLPGRRLVSLLQLLELCDGQIPLLL